MRKEYLKFTNIDDEEIELRHGDVISVISKENNCGLDITNYVLVCVFERGLSVGIPNDPIAHSIRNEIIGVSFLMDLEWLIEQDVDITIIHKTET